MYAPVELNRTWRSHSWSHRSFIARPWTELAGISAFPAGRSTPETIEIRHTSCSGLEEIVIRPGTSAVSLFWRFVSVKFGIEPGEHHG